MAYRRPISDVESEPEIVPFPYSDMTDSSDEEEVLISRKSKVDKTVVKKMCWDSVRWTRLGNITLIDIGGTILFIGPHWRYALATFLFILTCTICLFVFVLRPNVWEEVVLCLGSVACLSGFVVLIIADPGIVKKYDRPLMPSWSKCTACNTFRPPKTMHCKHCDRCILSHHHHCLFVGKCIGMRNRWEFRIFFISTIVLLLYAIIILIVNLV